MMMDDEDDKKEDVDLSDTSLDEMLDETEDDEEEDTDAVAGLDEFGGEEKQWE